MNPLISILIPVKDEERFLLECLESIQRQSYTNFEVILVDDFSEDSSWSILEQFCKNDARFYCFKNQEAGVISALRLAFSKSSGELITRMDADDLMRKEKIQVLAENLLSAGKSHVAIGGVYYFAEVKLKSGYKNYQVWLNRLTKSGDNFKEIFKECSIPSPCWMLYREDLEKINAFNENRYPEDYDLAFRMYEAGIDVVPTDKILHDWRDYDNRTSRIDPNYHDYTFTNIKWYYFDKIHYNKSRGIAVMGTSFRGKQLAKFLIENEIDFIWFSKNENKIGKSIYEKQIYVMEDKSIDWKNYQIITTFKDLKAKDYIQNFLLRNGVDVEGDLYHFC